LPQIRGQLGGGIEGIEIELKDGNIYVGLLSILAKARRTVYVLNKEDSQSEYYRWDNSQSFRLGWKKRAT
jgi:hypothetical protein